MFDVPKFTICALLALFAFASSPSPGKAHIEGGVPQGARILFSADGSPLAVVVRGAGVLLRSDDEWSLLCTDALELLSQVEIGLRRDSDDHFLLNTFAGVLHGTPDACTWKPLDPLLSDRNVISLTADPDDPNTLYALTGQGNEEDAAYVSHDEGSTWELLFDVADNVGYREMFIAPSDGDRWYLSGIRLDFEMMKFWPIFETSVDRGRSVQRRDIDDSWDGFRILAVHPKNPDQALAAYIEEEPIHTNTGLTGGIERILLTTDGGDSWDRVAQVGEFIAITQSPDGEQVWISDHGGGLLYSSNGGREFETINSEFGSTCLEYHEGRLWGCGNLISDGFNIGVSDDNGATFEEFLDFDSVGGSLECDELDVQTACEESWMAWRFWFGYGVTSSDAGTPMPDATVTEADGSIPPSLPDSSADAAAASEDSSGCGCRVAARRSNGIGFIVPVVAAASLALRRRRRPSRPGPARWP